MRVALLTYSTKARGGVVHTLSLAEALARTGHDVDVWSLARGGDDRFFRPVDRLVNLKLVPFDDADETVGTRILRSILALREAFDRHTSGSGSGTGYDVVHAQDCISANAVDRCIRTVHHLDTFTTAELIACHERAIVRPIAHICVSSAVAAELRAGWGVTPTVIGNGIDSERFAAAASADAAAVANRRRWADELGPYVLAVGGIEPRKGTDDLIEAMAVLQRERPELGLVIGGGETLFDYRDYRDRVLARASELAVRLRVLGPVAHDELPALMAQASAFAFPSRKEGFGLAAMEALAAGVPVVLRDLPVLREVFGDAATYARDAAGLAAQLLLAVTDPAADPTAGRDAEADGRARRGRALAAQHRWSDVAAEHVRFYHRVSGRGLP